MVLGAMAFMGLALAACSGDDTDSDRGQASGSLATVTPTAISEASPTQTRILGTLVPLDTPTPEATATAPPSGTSSPALDTASMIDMAPCADQTYFEIDRSSKDTPALAYKDVPGGTPILFPFKKGHVKRVDAREGAISILYDVDGVGVFMVEAAGTGTLDRTIDHVVEGTVIGHFSGTFSKDVTDVFQGYQLFAVIGDEEMVQIGNQLYSGQAVVPNVTDCLVLP
jgi:hypothetical protein